MKCEKWRNVHSGTNLKQKTLQILKGKTETILWSYNNRSLPGLILAENTYLWGSSLVSIDEHVKLSKHLRKKSSSSSSSSASTKAPLSLMLELTEVWLTKWWTLERAGKHLTYNTVTNTSRPAAAKHVTMWFSFFNDRIIPKAEFAIIMPQS